MDDSATGWVAVFKPFRTEPVVGWDQYGDALIVDAARGRRVSIHDLPDHTFENLQSVDQPIVAALPAAGWTLQWPDGEIEPVIGFVVQDDGYTLPVIPHLGGFGAPAVAMDGEPAPELIPPGSAGTPVRTEIAPAIPNPQVSDPAPVDHGRSSRDR